MAAASEPIRLALVWHFHQPDYTDPLTGNPFLPWTRLHALKDYADMAAHLERHPEVRATFNVVPTLLRELRAYAEGTAHPDPFLTLSRTPAAALDADGRRLLVSRFFSFNRATLANGLPRLIELAALRGDYPIDEVPAAVVRRFDDQALRDLQVLFHLAWSGALLLEEPLVQALRAKGGGFTEAEKGELLELQDRFVAGVLPRWQALARSGQVEFSVSPWAHPILPLLCDLESAHEALPGLVLPRASFRHPEDADLHLATAAREFESIFGARAAGGWPSEGAISETALDRMHAAGWGWAASDEDVLFASLGERPGTEPRRAALLSRVWRYGAGPALLFRDHDLSDRIGFTYATWHPRPAAEDFVRRLLRIRAALPADHGPAVVSVILDGENAWEYYRDHGAPFFEALYSALAAEPDIRTCTASEAVALAAPRPLPRVVAGSWIAHNLATWIGHPEKNAAWELLAAAREAVGSVRGRPDLADPAWRAIFAAEGSDWFWWLGDDHPTAFAGEFDAAFRRHLRAAYAAAGLDVPPRLHEPIRRRTVKSYQPPVGPVTPHLDGEVSDYFEWLPAGRAAAVSGTMQSSARLVRQVFYGSDGERLYLRLDPSEGTAAALAGGILVIRALGAPDRVVRGPLPEAGRLAVGPLELAVGRVVEASLPLSALGNGTEELRFQIEVDLGGGRMQRIPGEGSLHLPAAEEDPSKYDWSV